MSCWSFMLLGAWICFVIETLFIPCGWVFLHTIFPLAFEYGGHLVTCSSENSVEVLGTHNSECQCAEVRISWRLELVWRLIIVLGTHKSQCQCVEVWKSWRLGLDIRLTYIMLPTLHIVSLCATFLPKLIGLVSIHLPWNVKLLLLRLVGVVSVYQVNWWKFKGVPESVLCIYSSGDPQISMSMCRGWEKLETGTGN